MALNVAWRWAMPQVASPNAQADDMAAGVQGLAQGIGKMIGGIRQENREDEQRRQAQENLDRAFEQQKMQNAQTQRNWLQQFAQNKFVQDETLRRQKEQDEWLRRVYGVSSDQLDRWQELQRLRAKYGNEPQPVSDTQKIMMGLNPSL